VIKEHITPRKKDSLFNFEELITPPKKKEDSPKTVMERQKEIEEL